MADHQHRLYLTLHVKGGAPVVPVQDDNGPTTQDEESKGYRYQARKRTIGPDTSLWQYDQIETTMLPSAQTLVRIVLGKVVDLGKIHHILSNVPLRPEEEGWDSIVWVKEGIEALLREEDAAVEFAEGVTWENVRVWAMWYVGKKEREHRFDGEVSFDPLRTPTWDMFCLEETEP
ncbi:hypothetical protein B0J18DRAFT_458059 [Chaetomium sp. MPI-SDFR-AT-0129]|nr:hypothetical protein B0J18DRAFT_458059 [Chaetomium sp. MPI-SDFR-AT-0129]